jgi:hypothetical protein
LLTPPSPPFAEERRRVRGLNLNNYVLKKCETLVVSIKEMENGKRKFGGMLRS